MHLKEPDREKNWFLFKRLYGKKCLQVCKEALERQGRTMKPRIPGERLLDSLRPNNCKYFKKTSLGECSLCKPSYDNYKIFVDAVHELKPDVELPDTISLYARFFIQFIRM